MSECSYSWCVISVFDLLTLALYFAMTNHFCVVLFQCLCDMDHESNAKIKIVIWY